MLFSGDSKPLGRVFPAAATDAVRWQSTSKNKEVAIEKYFTILPDTTIIPLETAYVNVSSGKW
jgi:hypothetical protein